eukprot:TRINITY_DN9086_c0_g1_i1.p1 TRINITY_DN9086_c0_g1~~TRINITY_DN9086_c0_g1_i1.p1  ORF type:complete len:569 (-),score=106.49 TRINITY_DN9086_c0_g1_i1:9-1715(-)
MYTRIAILLLCTQILLVFADGGFANQAFVGGNYANEGFISKAKNQMLVNDPTLPGIVVTVGINGQASINETFRVLPAQDFTRFLFTAGMNLGVNAKRVFSQRGAEITEIELLRDRDFVFVSEGEDFDPVTTRSINRNDPFPGENFSAVVIERDGKRMVSIKGLQKKPIGIPISITTLTGWGNFAFHLAYELLKSDEFTPILLDEARGDVFLYDMDSSLRWQLRKRTDQWKEIEALIAKENLGDAVKFDFPLVLALASEMKGITDYRGSKNIGFMFFEDPHFSDEALIEGKTYDIIIGGSTWNSDVLRNDWKQDHVYPVLQGVDLQTFSPKPKQGLYPGRFVVFSGGKLEFRKAQDVVVAAFKRFQRRHPDALLVVAWQNFWHKTIDGIEQTGYVEGKPDYPNDGILRIEEWLTNEANGLPVGSVKSLGPIPNSRFARELSEADVALFPNRCEGGTNLVAMEAFAAAIPTIISANSGHLDLIDDSRCYPLRLQYKSPRGHWKSMKGWGDPDVNEIVDLLEHVYTHPEEAAEKGRRASEFMQDLSWEKQVPRFMNQIRGVLDTAYAKEYQ